MGEDFKSPNGVDDFTLQQTHLAAVGVPTALKCHSEQVGTMEVQL